MFSFGDPAISSFSETESAPETNKASRREPAE
jgi:hypothetical protein